MTGEEIVISNYKTEGSKGRVILMHFKSESGHK